MVFALAGWAGYVEGTLVPEAVHSCFQDSPWEMKEKNVPTAPSLPLGRVVLHWALITPLQWHIQGLERVWVWGVSYQQGSLGRS